MHRPWPRSCIRGFPPVPRFQVAQLRRDNMHQRERNLMVERSSAAVGTMFTVAFIAIAAIPATAQQPVPFRIGMQLPAIFEYLYINFAIESGLLKNEGIDGKIVGFTA